MPCNDETQPNCQTKTWFEAKLEFKLVDEPLKPVCVRLPTSCNQSNSNRCLECGADPTVSPSVWQSSGVRHMFPSIPLSRHFRARVVMTQLFTAGLTNHKAKKIPAACDLSGREGQAPYLAPIFLDPSFFDSPSPPPPCRISADLNSVKRAFQNTSAPCSCSGMVSSAPARVQDPSPLPS